MLEGLRNEHKNTKYILGLLYLAVTRWEQGDPVPLEILVEGVEILQHYAEESHQRLEEELLFPIMEKDGVPWRGGPLEVLEKEHHESRGYLIDLQHALESLRHDDPNAKEAIAENIKAYIMLLKAHMDKEEMIVFPIAERLLEESDVLQGDFAKMAGHLDWENGHQEFIERLERGLGVSGRKVLDSFGQEQNQHPDHLAEEFLNRPR
ncbi:MAG TPA: hemerythrin domain-containing protein [Bacillota bacterium]|nr:hemerythrin domain-containing protein [Bacillota bacterium]